MWQGRWRIALVTVVDVALAALTVANTNPTYQADALLQLEERSGSLVLPSSLSEMFDKDPRSVTEIEILRSRTVLGRAVADQNLDWRIKPDILPVFGTMFARYQIPFVDDIIPARFARPADGIALANFVVPPDMLNEDISLIVTGENTYQLLFRDHPQLEGRVGDPMNVPEMGFAITVAELAAPVNRHFSISQIDERRAINVPAQPYERIRSGPRVGHT